MYRTRALTRSWRFTPGLNFNPRTCSGVVHGNTNIAQKHIGDTKGGGGDGGASAPESTDTSSKHQTTVSASFGSVLRRTDAAVVNPKPPLLVYWRWADLWVLPKVPRLDLAPSQLDAIDAALLPRTDPDHLATNSVAHRVALCILECDGSH